MNTHNESILAEYRQNHNIYEQLERTASALLESELKQSGIMVFQLSHRLKTEESLRGKLEKKGDKYERNFFRLSFIKFNKSAKF